MSAAPRVEPTPPRARRPAPPPAGWRPRAEPRAGARRRAVAVVGGARGVLLVRARCCASWGADHGLPYAYNADENAHFVPRAIGLYGHEWNPDYFVNPPAYTYVLHVVFTRLVRRPRGRLAAVRDRPDRGVGRRARHRRRCSARSPSGCSTSPARGCSTAASACSPRRSSAVAFLPVFYSHLALNDVPTLAPVCLALCGVAGRRCARAARATTSSPASGSAWPARRSTPAGIVLLPLLAAAAVQFAAPGGRAPALRGAGRSRRCAALAAFVVANPYAVLDFPAFWDGITHQSDGGGRGRRASSASPTRTASSTTCGRSPGGWAGCRCSRPSRRVPLLWRDERRLVWLLAPAPIAVRAVHGHAGALLRPLADAGLPVRLPARRVRGDRARRPRRRAAGRRCGRRSSRVARGRAVRAGRRLLAAHRPGALAARTRATWPASGSSSTCRRGRRSSSSRSCPTRGRRTSATRRG